MLHSGIDLHKRTIVLSTVDAQGTRVGEAELPTSRAAVQAYFAAHREQRDLLRARLRLVSQQVRCRLIVEGLLAQYNVTSVGAPPRGNPLSNVDPPRLSPARTGSASAG